MAEPDASFKYRARQVRSVAELAAVQSFRARCFTLDAKTDADAFDARCEHMVIEDAATDRLLCCFRMMLFEPGQVDHSYSAQFYDLSALRRFEGRVLELGRFCIDPDARDPDILRAAWAAMTAHVDATGARLLMGCSSFAGTDTAAYRDAFAVLKSRYLAPARWQPLVKAPDVFCYAAQPHHTPDLKAAMRHMPPLLRTYLLMGGWVSDHAVVDARMNTLHVFTGVEISAIPAARKRLLRALV